MSTNVAFFLAYTMGGVYIDSVSWIWAAWFDRLAYEVELSVVET